MKVFAVVMLVTALWIVLGAVLSGCSSRQTASDRPGADGDPAWLWESVNGEIPLARRATLPPSHPLARLGRAPSRSV